MKYLGMTALSFGMLFGLASCNSAQEAKEPEGLENTEDREDTQNNGQSSTENKENPTSENYVSVEVNYTTASSPATDVESAVEKIYDSVVSINSYTGSGLYGSGSGVLFASDEETGLSFIVTCHHVIDSCSSFTVTLSNGVSYPAELVGGDAQSDIAVLSVEAVDLNYAVWFQDTDTLKLGSTVICIGNPLGTLPGSVSTGIISYNNREVQVDDYQTMTLIQTDVAINSGNSGGGLFNAAGALIGIVNAKYSSSGIEGLGFSIPANQARTIIDSILSTARYNTESKTWSTGYVEGRWILEVEFGVYRVSIMSQAIAVSAIANNTTASDYGKFQLYDRIESVTIQHKDESRVDAMLSTITSVSAIYSFIYEAEAEIGDKIIFKIYRGNNSTAQTVEIELSQYRYFI